MTQLPKPDVLATVVILLDKEEKVILARKKKAIHHDTGEISYSLGLYNGYGGKMDETDATIEMTAIRELYDESGVTGKEEDLESCARVYFYVQKEGEDVPFMDVTFYLLKEWSGVSKEGLEMGEPVFFSKDALPYEEMMPADKILFGKILGGEKGEYNVFLRGKDTPPVIEEVR
jgi:8-oxo-dGTP pyrophosphatase MutT (NUDIX family)